MTIEDIEKEVLAWHRETFPRATFDAISDKIIEEAGELLDAVEYYQRFDDKKQEIPLELADVAIAGIALLNRMGTSLSAVIAAKLATNKARVWGDQEPNGDRKRIK